jgi:hypothetical protein
MSGSRIDCPISGDLIVRATQRAGLAGKALEHAAEDLRAAGSGDGALEGLAELLLDEAGLVSRMAEDIDSRRQQEDAPLLGGNGHSVGAGAS